MNKHLESLRILSEWLLAQDIDMKLPEGVIDPAETAEYIRTQLVLRRSF